MANRHCYQTILVLGRVELKVKSQQGLAFERSQIRWGMARPSKQHGREVKLEVPFPLTFSRCKTQDVRRKT
jgi:hypothetical protein